MSIREQLSKIIFKNKPDKTTPISAGNLNQLQDNIESALRKKFDYSVTYVTDANNMTEQGIYIINSVAVNLPFDPDEIITRGDLAWLIVISLSGFDPVIQIAFESKTFEFWIRKSDYYEESGWTEWKILNLENKIITGEEMPTNIYSDGKQVYVKRFKGDSLPSSDTISTGIDMPVTLYKLEGMAIVDNKYLPIPYVATNFGISSYYLKDSKSIFIQSEIERADYSYYIDFYYTYDD